MSEHTPEYIAATNELFQLRAINAKLLVTLAQIKEYSLDPWAKRMAEEAIAKVEGRE